MARTNKVQLASGLCSNIVEHLIARVTLITLLLLTTAVAHSTTRCK